MKRAPWFLLAGAVAGFAGVLGLHGRPAASAATSQPRNHQRGGRGQAPVGPAAASGAVRSATGALEQYGYGELDVKVTVRGSRIADISVPTIRVAEPYSQRLADQVIPMLKSEVLSVQSGQINGVSGATYTSEAYAMSLQSALDKLHVK